MLEATGLGRSTVYRMIAERAFPAPVKLAKRAVAWRDDDVRRWASARPSTSDGRFDGSPPLRDSGSGHVRQHRLDRIVRAGSRERLTLDPRGLGPAIRAHAKARNMAVSSFARLAVAKMLAPAE